MSAPENVSEYVLFLHAYFQMREFTFVFGRQL